ncbi:MAG: hypothetical protein EXR05_05920 [Acetobacteraceae bacterium]|nr:hypothetical protein [Acetobacteraceae bacterium]
MSNAMIGRAVLWPLFLISAGAVGYEIALTRYFAVTKWSEYGYWVISIVMVGFALSGVVMALARDVLVRHAAKLFAGLPVVLVATAAIGFHLTTINPFNPLQLQNPATYEPQLWNIAGYYLALLPFFFLTGIYVSLSFVLNAGEIGRVYGFDLTGAGLGAAAALALMFVLHPFALVPVLLVPIAASALFVPGRWRRVSLLATLLALLGGEGLLLLGGQVGFNEFKSIYAPLNTPNAKIVAEILAPRGTYLLLDDFTERVDTDLSNNAAMLGLPGPPASFGLYRDGNRLAALPKPGPIDVGYAGATLDAAPYGLIPAARVLLGGTSGGFRIAAVRALGAGTVDALEPEPVLLGALRHGLGPSPAYPVDPVVRLLPDGPVAALLRGPAGRYDIIDLSADFMDAAEANMTAFTAEAINIYLRALAPAGIVSIPVSIRDFPVYALRMLATVREGIHMGGFGGPNSRPFAARHVMVIRSAWSVRILISPMPWDAARIAMVKTFCDERSFDVSYYPGFDRTAARAQIYNDMPAVSFTIGAVTTEGPADAIADEVQAMLDGVESADPTRAFNLDPTTMDRPSFYAVLRLSQLETILKRLEILPQAEISGLVNLFVLAQAVIIALFVLVVPLFAPAQRRARETDATRPAILRAIIYFPALGLGFLFIEMFVIDKASFYLNDRASAFALVLTGMLIFSGLGSMLEHLFEAAPRRGIRIVCGVTLLWCLAVGLGLEAAMMATLDLPWLIRAALVLLLVAPVSVALGLPFPLGLSRTGGGFMLPWAWGLNGAFSVVATPLANLIARDAGFSRVLLCAAILYIAAVLTFPIRSVDLPRSSPK